MPGQSVITPDERKVFLRGQMLDTADGPMFLHGDVMVNNKNQVQFLPGQLVYNEERDKEEFIPGITGETTTGAEKPHARQILKSLLSGTEFLEGRLIKKGEEAVFVPGKTTVFIDGTANR